MRKYPPLQGTYINDKFTASRLKGKELQKKVIIVGGGSCALMFAAELDAKKFEVHLYEKNATLGRKFLVAGDGGLNLTHSEELISLQSRYTPSEFIADALQGFTNQHLIKWFNDSGIETFIGSSGRVFPKKEIKPIEVLNLFLAKIRNNNVRLHLKHTWQGFEKGQIRFINGQEEIFTSADIIVFCLGGASWPVTGSAGGWLSHFQNKDILAHPFEASNCSFMINWPEEIVSKTEGKALKNISLSCGSIVHKGEVVLTRTGIEGSGIYPLSPEIRRELKTLGHAQVFVDLKISFSRDQVISKLNEATKNKNISRALKEDLNLSDVQMVLLKNFTSKQDFLDIEKISQHIKGLQLKVHGTGNIEDAISTVGGIDLSEIDKYFQLKKMRGTYAIGEMLDYDAPTGGYLLQSCFSMAKYLADHLNKQAS